jgi:hypothetical protein
MAYYDFSLDRVRRDFSLVLDDDVDLFDHVGEVPVSPTLRSSLDECVPLAIDIGNEKARSELIIAPILLEVRRLTGRRIGFFTGVEFDVARDRGLTGFCDFILSRSRLQVVLSAPVMTIVEAKHENIKAGLGQCAAAMVAARIFNEREGDGPTTIHGAVTSGTNWRFLKLESNDLVLDRQEYALEPVGRILAILLHCVGIDPAAAGAAA